ncbi:hypothetical protein Cantr_04643 [Candida viswanathii]|uniref:Uncharacterized protein n=1 Tax=Candida viswanathii TaxID=5486 RepID=A0A367XN10_9ASCO|nr:hypothetical protein Cantr_04643 [Candida viswanathii]
MFKECIGCQQRRLEDEPVEDRIRLLCPACRITRSWNLYKHNGSKQTRMLSRKFNLITKLYCLKQIDSSHTDLKFIKSALLNDKDLSRFTGQLSIANYLAEIDRISQKPISTASSEATTAKTSKRRMTRKKKKTIHQQKVHKTSSQCSYCKKYRLLDEPTECLQYRQCPRCIMKRRIKTNVSVSLAEPVKLYALKQFKELLPRDDDLIAQVYRQDPFLRKFKNKKFHYGSEIAKYQHALTQRTEDSEDSGESGEESALDDGQRVLTTENLNLNHPPVSRIHISDVALVQPDSYEDVSPARDGSPMYVKLKTEPMEEVPEESPKECSRCHGLKRDEPELLKIYKRCAKCTFNARLKVGTGDTVPNIIKICALQQVLESSHYHTQSLKQKFLNDPFLSQFKKRAFNYKKELVKLTRG